MQYKVTKSKMSDIMAVFKRVLTISDSFILMNDCIIPDGNVKNGSHIIHLPFENKENGIRYTNDKYIATTMKELSDKKGLKEIYLLWDETFIGFIADNEPYMLLHAVPSIGDEMWFQDALDRYTDWVDICNDDLVKIKSSRIVKLCGNDSIIRISKNLVPCMGVLRKTAQPNFTAQYHCREDNVILLYVKYPIFEAIHAYSFSVIRED